MKVFLKKNRWLTQLEQAELLWMQSEGLQLGLRVSLRAQWMRLGRDLFWHGLEFAGGSSETWEAHN